MGGFDWTLTLRELIQAVRERERSHWARTSLLACILANSARDPKRQRHPFVPDDFNPYRTPTPKGIRLNKQTLHLFATAIMTARKG